MSYSIDVPAPETWPRVKSPAWRDDMRERLRAASERLESEVTEARAHLDFLRRAVEAPAPSPAPRPTGTPRGN